MEREQTQAPAGAQPIEALAGGQPGVETPAPGLPVASDEQQALEGTESGEAKQYKTLGIRVDNELHARLSFITQLRDSTLQGEILAAIRDRVAAAQQDPELIAKAAEVRAQIEAEARARQAAIAGMFGSVAVASEVETPARPPGRRSSRARDSGSTS
jgi:hypothetical protein